MWPWKIPFNSGNFVRAFAIFICHRAAYPEKKEDVENQGSGLISSEY